ncbi:hypothetical protein PAECIP111893_03509 [Paenibacillus plantiphilus]|uniref:Uncharacterized protein n=1 Tax=Paenibacillus plantiphilus TaxID=2905650 RepID=A0ABM9CF50_9BACL|nr:hypothetical protein [Paenibacillus plantiphilus]CAH1212250.1 hypothetical protein PAECIP111893_03509 [Paenibacillus plantiphilus]
MKKNTLTAVRISLLLVIALLILPSHIFANGTTQIAGAKTSPPPLLITPFTIFDPSFIYLEKGQGYISYSGTTGNYKVNIWAETFGVIRVDEIGVVPTLQRWTGSAWIDVFYGSNAIDYDSAYTYQSHNNISVLSGYYYRTKSYHWAKEGTTTESGYRYSSSVLIP